MRINTEKTPRIDDVHTDFDHQVVTSGPGFAGSWQVILFNDEHNTCDYVAQCLMTIFGHSFEMAKKLMLEAHQKGKTIAQVEGQIEAIAHAGQLRAAGLRSQIEKF